MGDATDTGVHLRVNRDTVIMLILAIRRLGYLRQAWVKKESCPDHLPASMSPTSVGIFVPITDGKIEAWVRVTELGNRRTSRAQNGLKSTHFLRSILS